MKGRVTQTDIARAAGVHNTTVSLALRNSRLLPEPTRERIQAIARSMGYHPDPALRALVAYRNSRRTHRQLETLAYLTNWDTKWGWRLLPAHERYYTAAQRKAAELGYQLEHVWLGEAGMSQRRLDRMLLHRGISGVLLASHRTSCDELAALDWSRLSAVRIGCFPHVPALNQVAVDPGSVMRLAVRQVLQDGYQRIGLALPRRWDELADQAWSAAFHAEQYRCALKDRLPVLHLPDGPEEEAGTAARRPVADTGALTRWYRQHRPDVIIGITPAVLGHIRRSGLRVPADVAYADLFLQDTDYALAGVWENCEKVGELAVETLVHQLEQNVLGIPATPTVTSVGGLWRAGASLPSKTPAVLGELETPEPAINANLVA